MQGRREQQPGVYAGEELQQSGGEGGEGGERGGGPPLKKVWMHYDFKLLSPGL